MRLALNAHNQRERTETQPQEKSLLQIDSSTTYKCGAQ